MALVLLSDLPKPHRQYKEFVWVGRESRKKLRCREVVERVGHVYAIEGMQIKRFNLEDVLVEVPDGLQLTGDPKDFNYGVENWAILGVGAV